MLKDGKLNCKRLGSPLALRCCRLRIMSTAHNVAIGYELQHQIKETLNSKELQNAINLLIDWMHSGELRIPYYYFMLICDILQSIGIKINNDELRFHYIAAYLLLSKVEDIMNIDFGASSYEMSQNVKELVYKAVEDSLARLEQLSSQLFASS